MTTAMSFGGLVAVAAPSHADGPSCGSATPFAGAVANSVGPGDAIDYWAYDTLVGTYEFTVSSGSAATNLYVDNTTCTTVLCNGVDTGGAGTVEKCTINVTTPSTVKIRVSNYSTSTDTYTLSGLWKTVPPLGTQCSDGLDNDADGATDTGDTGCTGPLDTTEGSADACPSIAGIVTCLSLTAGDEITRLNVFGPDLDEDVTVAGTIDLYQFALPTGGSLNIPCVVLTGLANPCADLGGTYFATILTLVPVTVPLVDPLIDEFITSIGICEATLTATVNSIGVEDFPAVTVC